MTRRILEWILKLFLFTGCISCGSDDFMEDSDQELTIPESDCGGEFVEQVNEWEGTFFYPEDNKEVVAIRSFIRGTIDSNYLGFLCTEDVPDLLNHTRVRFSGIYWEINYEDTLDSFFPRGGERRLILEPTFIEVIE